MLQRFHGLQPHKNRPHAHFAHEVPENTTAVVWSTLDNWAERREEGKGRGFCSQEGNGREECSVRRSRYLDVEVKEDNHLDPRRRDAADGADDEHPGAESHAPGRQVVQEQRATREVVAVAADPNELAN